MANKILGIVCFTLCAASQVLIRHHDTATFFSVLFFVIGAYEFILGDIRLRRLFRSRAQTDVPAAVHRV